jgi:HEAT repeat protein
MYDYRSTLASAFSIERSLSLDNDAERLLHDLLNGLKYGDFQGRWDVAKRFPELLQNASFVVPQNSSDLSSSPISELLNLLDNDEEDWELAWFVTRILGELRHPNAIASLLHLAQTSPHDEIVQAATMALANHGDSAIAPLTELLQIPHTRSIAAQSLTQISTSSATAVLLSIADDPDPSVRTVAIAALSHTQDERVFPILMQRLHDPIVDIRCAALAGLGFWADPPENIDLVTAIEPLLWDINLTVRQQAILTLGRLGSIEAITHLVSALHSAKMPDILRPHLVHVMGWSEAPRAIAALCHELHAQLQATGNNPDLTREIITVLGRVQATPFKPVITQQLLNVLQTKQDVLRQLHLIQAIAFSLGQLGQPEAVDTLQNLAKDEDDPVKFHAQAALKMVRTMTDETVN